MTLFPPLKMIAVPAALLLGAGAVQAETTVIHAIEGRFGVSYNSDPNAPRGGLQPLYEGRYTTSFLHESDGGLRFRFDIGVVVGNIQSERQPHPWRSADRRSLTD